jgi:hypothetical protein
MVEVISVLKLSYLEKLVSIILNLRADVEELIASRCFHEFIKLLMLRPRIPCYKVHYLCRLFGARVKLEAGLTQPHVTVAYAHVSMHI